MSSKTLKQNANVVLLDKTAFTGSVTDSLLVLQGARLVIGLKITAIDEGASVSIAVKNGFDGDNFDTLETFEASTISLTKKVYTDFFESFQVVATVTGGNATFKLAATVFDNALPVTIENAAISVALSHASDSVKVGNGSDFLAIAADGSIAVTNASLLAELEQKADLTDTQPVSAASLPLPEGASTESTLSALSAKLPTSIGQKASTASLSVVLASNATLPVTLAPTGAGNLASLNAAINIATEGRSALSFTIFDNSPWVATIQFQGTSDNINWTPLQAIPIPSGAPTTDITANGYWSVSCAGWHQVRAKAIAWSSGSARVVYEISSSTNVVHSIPADKASTATLSQVAISATSVSLVAANVNRKGLILTNGGSQIAYVSFAATATTTAYTIALAVGAQFVMDNSPYIGALSAIWADTGTGSMQVTELT